MSLLLIIFLCCFMLGITFQYSVTRPRDIMHRILLQSSATDDLNDNDDKSVAEEQSRLNAILKEQGISLEDVQKLRAALSAGNRYNKREDPPVRSERVERIDKKVETPPPVVSKDITNDIEPASIVKKIIKSSTTTTPESKRVSIRPQIKLRNSKSAAAASAPSSSASDTDNTDDDSKLSTSILSSTRTSSSSETNEKRNRNSNNGGIISLEGMTLQKMVSDLVEEYGFSYLYQQTSLRCFNSNPTLTSTLKVLRQENMLWARKKVEYLFLEMMKDTRNIK